MGNRSTHIALNQAVHRAEDRSGRIQIEGRYHQLSKNVEDDYILDKTVLGSGANGAVVRATSRYTSMQVAVKSLNLRHLTGEKKTELLNEVEVFLRMDHPHVARLYDVYEMEHSLVFVMECMDGGELYDRVSAKKVFPEYDAAEAARQMLLAVNYLHSEGVVHRDIKLENFLYEKQGSDYLKLIDFGFSKICQKDGGLHVSCGTVSYVAPEVLDKNYGSQCDMWSLGVVVFVLLAGYMPFSGKTDDDILDAVRHGRYVMKAKRWSNVSQRAMHFVKNLLVVEPEYRMTAEQALKHPWIDERHKHVNFDAVVDDSIADSLVSFAKQSRFKRACMQLMAWSLTKDDWIEVRGAFEELDQHHTGVIKLMELKQILEDKFHLDDSVCSSVVSAFANLDHESDTEIHYSDFLAAMMSSRLHLHDKLLMEAFRHFDTDKEGHISLANFQHVFGDGEDMEEVFHLVDSDRDGFVCVQDLVTYLRTGQATNPKVHDTAHDLIDQGLRKRGDMERTKSDPDHHGFMSSAMRHLGTGFLRRNLSLVPGHRRQSL